MACLRVCGRGLAVIGQPPPTSLPRSTSESGRKNSFRESQRAVVFGKAHGTKRHSKLETRGWHLTMMGVCTYHCKHLIIPPLTPELRTSFRERGYARRGADLPA